jgi:hypothetical protein
MPYTIDRVDVWAGAIKDRPGGMLKVLESLANAGANLEFVIARRKKKGTGLIFVAPLKGRKQTKAAKQKGLAKAESLQSLRVEGTDKAGLGARITCALAEAGLNVRGLSAAALGKKSVVYLAFDSRADSTKARKVLKKALRIK